MPDDDEVQLVDRGKSRDSHELLDVLRRPSLRPVEAARLVGVEGLVQRLRHLRRRLLPPQAGRVPPRRGVGGGVWASAPGVVVSRGYLGGRPEVRNEGRQMAVSEHGASLSLVFSLLLGLRA